MLNKVVENAQSNVDRDTVMGNVSTETEGPMQQQRLPTPAAAVPQLEYSSSEDSGDSVPTEGGEVVPIATESSEGGPELTGPEPTVQSTVSSDDDLAVFVGDVSEIATTISSEEFVLVEAPTDGESKEGSS